MVWDHPSFKLIPTGSLSLKPSSLGLLYSHYLSTVWTALTASMLAVTCVLNWWACLTKLWALKTKKNYNETLPITWTDEAVAKRALTEANERIPNPQLTRNVLPHLSSMTLYL